MKGRRKKNIEVTWEDVGNLQLNWTIFFCFQKYEVIAKSQLKKLTKLWKDVSKSCYFCAWVAKIDGK